MACDTFSSTSAERLLAGKCLCFFGDSNIRALYKDLTWLLEDGRLIPDALLKRKNESSHANDVRISSGELHNGCDYEEVRKYDASVCIKFQFITRLYLPPFIHTIKNLDEEPDFVIINSGVWDLSRWGSSGVADYKQNVFNTLKFLREKLPSTRLIWVTTLPPAFNSQGGFLTKEIEYVRNMLPYHILYANQYAGDVANFFQVDVLDLHYYFRFLINHQTNDGIHWTPKAVRYATNLLLTHVALTRNYKSTRKCVLDCGIPLSSTICDKGRGQKDVYAVWQDSDIDTFSTKNENLYSQVKIYNRFTEIPKIPLDMPKNGFRYRRRYPGRNITNYNWKPSQKINADGNHRSCGRNIQNPGRINKNKYKKEEQVRANLTHAKHLYNPTRYFRI